MVWYSHPCPIRIPGASRQVIIAEAAMGVEVQVECTNARADRLPARTPSPSAHNLGARRLICSSACNTQIRFLPTDIPRQVTHAPPRHLLQARHPLRVSPGRVPRMRRRDRQRRRASRRSNRLRHRTTNLQMRMQWTTACCWGINTSARCPRGRVS